jgi:tetratricopeptide (TPR) repeat protein
MTRHRFLLSILIGGALGLAAWGAAPARAADDETPAPRPAPEQPVERQDPVPPPGPVILPAPGPAPRIVPRTGIDPSRLQALPRPEVRRREGPVDVAALRADSAFARFRVQLAAGDLARARAELEAVIKATRRDPLRREVAEFDLVELDFFAARFDTAQAGYRQFAALHGRGFLTNDAIARFLLIDENSDAGAKPLALYAEAARAARSARPDSAATVLRTALERHPGVALEDDLHFALGEVELELGVPAAALRHFTVVADSMPDSPLAPAALIRIGNYHLAGDRDKKAAMAAYEKVLERYPEAVEAGEARERLEHLRLST